MDKEVFESAIVDYFNSLIDNNVDVKNAQMTILFDINNILFHLEAARYDVKDYDSYGTCYKCQKYSKNEDFRYDDNLYKLTHTNRIICQPCYNNL